MSQEDLNQETVELLQDIMPTIEQMAEGGTPGCRTWIRQAKRHLGKLEEDLVKKKPSIRESYKSASDSVAPKTGLIENLHGRKCE